MVKFNEILLGRLFWLLKTIDAENWLVLPLDSLIGVLLLGISVRCCQCPHILTQFKKILLIKYLVFNIVVGWVRLSL